MYLLIGINILNSWEKGETILLTSAMKVLKEFKENGVE